MAENLLATFGLMVEVGASDLHLTAGAPPVLRLHGHLWRLPELAAGGPGQAGERAAAFMRQHPACGRALETGPIGDLVSHLLSRPELRERLQERGSVDLPYSVRGMSRFRVNVFRQRGSAAVVVRSLAVRAPVIDELFGHQAGLADTVKRLTQLQRGLVLVAGPSGSGRSTTLASMIAHMVHESPRHVITLESPIEYQIQHGRGLVNQREVGDDVDSFAAGLQAALRADPDVIVVGEMADASTIAAALTAAENDRLVFSTLHTRTAVETVARIVEAFPPNQQEGTRAQLAGSLEAVICQQLLPRASEPGMVAAAEVLVASPVVRSMIREQRLTEIPSVIQTGWEAGMVPMDRALADLARAGLVTQEQASDRAVDRKVFAGYSDRLAGPPKLAARGPTGSSLQMVARDRQLW